jgi:WXG100 family type VII secretion target
VSNFDVLVTFGAIEQAQSDVTTTVASIDQQMSDLQSYLAPIVSTWKGQAFDQYQALQQQWNQALNDLNSVLAQIGSALGEAYSNYTATEQANANVWG